MKRWVCLKKSKASSLCGSLKNMVSCKGKKTRKKRNLASYKSPPEEDSLADSSPPQQLSIESESKEESVFETKKNESDVWKIINSQDFVEGYWELNEETKIVKEKYEKEFELLKGLKGKNIDDKIDITILIIYFINNQHPELLNQLVMVIRKAKLFII